ncbi:GNAT family N-acetyltransferase [Streptomyces sp. SID3343]|uniref:GNAT family N-acetyltransferase n=1 Tax=Streptomyces sp. SID3343 TaxID=2690260 RepID=UPI00136B2FEF|nr:GNAT family N-acetyltransferase [Streptomyces sp. SID3343]MYV97404.1 GNAT family N-acetyltransferase [Streptomyces sp. SID3343]
MTPRTLVAETERLLLTRPRPDDVAAVFAVHGDPATNLHNPNGPHRSPQESADLLRSMLDDWERDGIGYCAVARHDEPDALIGFAGTRLTRLNDVSVLNLYYRFAPSVWGYGLAGEAVGATLIVARRLFPEVPLTALIRDDNLSSRRLAERLGFRPDTGFEDPEGRSVYVLPMA